MRTKVLSFAFLLISISGCQSQEPTITSYPFTCNGKDYSLGGTLDQKPATINFDGETLSFSVKTKSGSFDQVFKLGSIVEGYLSDRGTDYVTNSEVKRYGDTFTTYTKTLNPDGSDNSFNLPEAQDFRINLKECTIRPSS